MNIIGFRSLGDRVRLSYNIPPNHAEKVGGKHGSKVGVTVGTPARHLQWKASSFQQALGVCRDVKHVTDAVNAAYGDQPEVQPYGTACA